VNGVRRVRCTLLSCLTFLALGCGGQAPVLSEGEPGGDGSAAEPVEVAAAPAEEAAHTAPAAERAMVLVAEGTFIMGWDAGKSDEQPPHAVFLDAFYIDQFEVMVQQYRSCVEAGGCEDPIYAPACNWDGFADNTHPINCVNRQNARDYCAWAGLRLPTEAEWEKAARGDDRRIYPWGDELLGDEANFRIGLGTATEPVGNHPNGISFSGAHDMAGNVWEWVEDWYAEDYYVRSPRKRPRGPEFGEFGVLRGGSWWFEAGALPAAHRVAYHPALTDIDIGFRCARDVK